MVKRVQYQAVVIGVSAGGLATLDKILPNLTKDFTPSVLIVQHIATAMKNYMVEHFRPLCAMKVKEGIDKVAIEPSTIYFAPPNYHILVEQEKTLALSTTEKVNYSRPSIDVLFDSAARVYCERLIGIILTGASSDGAEGIAMVKEAGGLTIVQDPETAEVIDMPEAALAKTEVDHILPPQDIAPFLMSLGK